MQICCKFLFDRLQTWLLRFSELMMQAVVMELLLMWLLLLLLHPTMMVVHLWLVRNNFIWKEVKSECNFITLSTIPSSRFFLSCSLISLTARSSFLSFILLFWNQILICLSVRHKAWAISILQHDWSIVDHVSRFLLSDWSMVTSFSEWDSDWSGTPSLAPASETWCKFVFLCV